MRYRFYGAGLCVCACACADGCMRAYVLMWHRNPIYRFIGFEMIDRYKICDGCIINPSYGFVLVHIKRRALNIIEYGC